MPKLTDEQIIKALECCEQNKKECTKCPQLADCFKNDLYFLPDTIDLINRLKAKYIRLLGAELEQYEKGYDAGYDDAYKTAKNEALKEFARKLKCGVPQETGVIRCADVDNLLKEMVVEGDLYHNYCWQKTHPDMQICTGLSKYLVDPTTIGQYTGLTDKNGTKIFEGDIVKHHFGNEYGVVKFGEYSQPFNDDEFTKHIGFYVDWVVGESKDTLRKDLGYWANIKEYEIVVGNIHNNPELLEVKDNG